MAGPNTVVHFVHLWATRSTAVSLSVESDTCCTCTRCGFLIRCLMSGAPIHADGTVIPEGRYPQCAGYGPSDFLRMFPLGSLRLISLVGVATCGRECETEKLLDRYRSELLSVSRDTSRNTCSRTILIQEVANGG